MLADPVKGAGMVNALKGAREAAAAGPPDTLWDWFDGANFRKLVTTSYSSTATCIAMSSSKDYFQVRKQRGFEC